MAEMDLYGRLLILIEKLKWVSTREDALEGLLEIGAEGYPELERLIDEPYHHGMAAFAMVLIYLNEGRPPELRSRLVRIIRHGSQRARSAMQLALIDTLVRMQRGRQKGRNGRTKEAGYPEELE